LQQPIPRVSLNTPPKKSEPNWIQTQAAIFARSRATAAFHNRGDGRTRGRTSPPAQLFRYSSDLRFQSTPSRLILRAVQKWQSRVIFGPFHLVSFALSGESIVAFHGDQARVCDFVSVFADAGPRPRLRYDPSIRSRSTGLVAVEGAGVAYLDGRSGTSPAVCARSAATVCHGAKRPWASACESAGGLGEIADARVWTVCARDNFPTRANL
jgi:hypothetical protein